MARSSLALTVIGAEQASNSFASVAALGSERDLLAVVQRDFCDVFTFGLEGDAHLRKDALGRLFVTQLTRTDDGFAMHLRPGQRFFDLVRALAAPVGATVHLIDGWPIVSGVPLSPVAEAGEVPSPFLPGGGAIAGPPPDIPDG